MISPIAMGLTLIVVGALCIAVIDIVRTYIRDRKVDRRINQMRKDINRVERYYCPLCEMYGNSHHCPKQTGGGF